MTEEEIITSILSSKNLYAVLNLEPNCTAEDIKRSYRKIAVLVHPDRCKHKKATEAFQRVSHAYQTLSNEEKRANYDRFGERSENISGTPGSSTGSYYTSNGFSNGNYYYSDITPEEIFDMFFGVNNRFDQTFRDPSSSNSNTYGYPRRRGNTYYSFNGFRQNSRKQDFGYSTLFSSIGTLLLVLFIVMLPSFIHSDNLEEEMIFPDLDKGKYNPRVYTSKMKSQKAKIPFYITRNYMRKRSPSYSE